MVTISLAGPFSFCTIFLCTGRKKLLMSFIPAQFVFVAALVLFLQKGCTGRLAQLLLGSLDRVQETNLKFVLLWVRCIAPALAVYIFPLLAV